MPTFLSYVCEVCRKPFQRRKGHGSNGRFCSRSCTARGTQAGWNRSNFTKECENCGGVFRLPESRAKTARACSRRCLGQLQSRERKGRFGVGELNPRYKNGIATYRRLKGTVCIRCASPSNLLVHHINHDRTNNTDTNLETLCSWCHLKEHGIEERRDPITGRFT